MSLLEAILFGFIQGITEFMPISSSGHLLLAQLFLGFKHIEQLVFFNLICHLGTLLALLWGFRNEIIYIYNNDRIRLCQAVLATLPLFPLVFLLKPLKTLFGETQFLGCCFLLTALILYLGTKGKFELDRDKLKRKWWKDALVIGTAQMVAIFPGISRSGATISTGRLLGWSQQDAMTFSFLLAIPTILGGIIVELWKAKSELGSTIAFSSDISITAYVAGFAASAGVGLLALRLLVHLLAQGKIHYFIWYCLTIGIFVLVYS